MMEAVSNLFGLIFDVSSVWSVVARAVVWFMIAGVIVISVDSPHPQNIHRSVKRNLGMFLLTLTVGGVLIYLLFSFTSTSLAST